MKKAILSRIACNTIIFAEIPSFLNSDLDVINAYIQSQCLKLIDLTNSNLLAQHTNLTRVISLLTEKSITHEKRTLGFQDILNIILTIRSDFLIKKMRTIIAYYQINAQEKRRIPTQIINSICQEIRIKPKQLKPDDLISLAQLLGRTTSLFTSQGSKHYQKFWFWQHNIDLICKLLPFNPNSYADLGWREQSNLLICKVAIKSEPSMSCYISNYAQAYSHAFINLKRLLYAQTTFSVSRITLKFAQLISTTCQRLFPLEINIIALVIQFLSLNDSKLLLKLCLSNKKKEVLTVEQECVSQSINQLCGTTLLFKATNFNKEIFIYKILYSGRFSPISWKRSLAAISPVQLILTEKFGSKQHYMIEQLSNFLLKLINTYFKQAIPRELVNYFSEFLSINDCHALFRAQYSKKSHDIETSEIKEIEAHTETTCSRQKLYQIYGGILLKH